MILWVIGGIVCLGVLANVSDGSGKNPPRATSQSVAATRSAPPPKPAVDAPLPPPKPGLQPVYAKTGIIQEPKGQKVAPLGIRTSGGSDYFIKLVDATSNRTVMTMYIEGGRYFETDVPLGRYIIRYAAGDKWYGLGHLFGPETHYSKAESVFNFTFDGYQYSGYTIELILQRNGNLSTHRISPSQF